MKQFHKLLKYDNPSKGNYEHLIQDPDEGYGVNGKLFDSCCHWPGRVGEGKYSGTRQYLVSKMKGHTLIDPGCDEGWRWMVSMAQDFGVKEYIGVDKHAFGSRCSVNSRIINSVSLNDTEKREYYPNIEVNLVEADMLNFISQLPENYANFTVNSIDSWVIPSFQYQQALAREIARATMKEGLVFGFNAEILNHLEENGLKPKTDLDYQEADGFERTPRIWTKE